MTSESPLSILVATPTDGENRVAATPDTVAGFRKKGFLLNVEAGAGERSFYPDQEYRSAGAEIVTPGSWLDYDVILTVSPWSKDGVLPKISQGALLVGFLDPYLHQQELVQLAADGVSTASVELVPRITRAQTMDALSSQASVAGYKAAVLAANTLAQYFPLMMTAAGTVSPARVVVMGGGVAGLQALATAKRLGSVVEVSDIREAVREQVESLGGRFIDLPELESSGEGAGGYAKEMTPEFLAEQRKIVAQRVAQADVVIATAQVPGKRAPLLITREMVESMRPGGVIVDLAAAQGGNCELTVSGQTTVHNGVTIIGPSNLAADVGHDASRLYARNLEALVLHLTQENTVQPLAMDLDDEITSQVLVTHAGAIVRPDIVQPDSSQGDSQ